MLDRGAACLLGSTAELILCPRVLTKLCSIPSGEGAECHGGVQGCLLTCTELKTLFPHREKRNQSRYVGCRPDELPQVTDPPRPVLQGLLLPAPQGDRLELPSWLLRSASNQCYQAILMSRHQGSDVLVGVSTAGRRRRAVPGGAGPSLLLPIPLREVSLSYSVVVNELSCTARRAPGPVRGGGQPTSRRDHSLALAAAVT
ncbi:hypothetical protein E2C01_033213 [Portunus trituberculatus]|uniref:Uncharacterized protein n=1 Tax=Portunus trituberculatus TaxID=210409 RepID=A0A5B7F3F2_PORTR|nr:hypothetical protein [Portunus trituberculatus]